MSAPADKELRDLARRLQLVRPLAFVDLETTGTSPENDRIVEIAVATVKPDLAVERYGSLVNPGVPIPASATEVHHISDADVAQAPPFAHIARPLSERLAGCDFAGFNLRSFDLRMLAAEFRRAGVAFDPQARKVVDAMAIFHQRERRDLTGAVRFYCGQEHHGHRAAEDVDATVRVLAAQLERYPDLPVTVDALDVVCNPRRPTWLTADGKVEWRDGAARITFGKHSGRSLAILAKNEPTYLRWILEKDFAEDLKKLAADALAGRFPEGPPAAGG